MPRPCSQLCSCGTEESAAAQARETKRSAARTRDLMGGTVKPCEEFATGHFQGKHYRPVRLFRQRAFTLVTALFAFFVFSGDLAADALADIWGEHCEKSSQDSPEKGPCSHCSCAAHNGAMAIAESLVSVSKQAQPREFLPATHVAVPPRLPTPIDHPPQLV